MLRSDHCKPTITQNAVNGSTTTGTRIAASGITTGICIEPTPAICVVTSTPPSRPNPPKSTYTDASASVPKGTASSGNRYEINPRSFPNR